MKEMLKNKTIVAFIIIMLGITIISTPSTNFNDNSYLDSSNLLYLK
ncbi:MAG TPA: hypothetical protein IAC20_00295 [Candidatus Faecisoma merdavium]|nr:hypothetical protein [Candidatus Faecisoma merdavium]